MLCCAVLLLLCTAQHEHGNRTRQKLQAQRKAVSTRPLSRPPETPRLCLLARSPACAYTTPPLPQPSRIHDAANTAGFDDSAPPRQPARPHFVSSRRGRPHNCSHGTPSLAVLACLVRYVSAAGKEKRSGNRRSSASTSEVATTVTILPGKRTLGCFCLAV